MKHIPQRTCVVCRRKRDKGELIRIVKGSDGTIVLDTDGKAQGRGAYICSDGDCAERAVSKRLLNRAFKANIDGGEYEKLGAAIKTFRRGEHIG